ncbi:hypothetical protein [Streptomyces liliifuscus]|uniref:Uncharacterized protein n=1 Tax=Streptomyces liliifuscus TaxID=2797636 RepID=A0A7T7L2G3_9ACTN|nr:hypothetical protein [Streptomyces liliifuscus]QQM45215.1 hypothetical protein JEQ17_41290 [Streptomyces liliifuscus]
MNGPEHYREGERLLAGQPKTAEDRERGIEGDDPWPPSRMELLEAQTHFLAALVALHAREKAPNSIAWQEAIGP